MSEDKLTKLFLDFGQELNGHVDGLIKLRGKMKIGLARQRKRLSSWTVDGSETVFRNATYSVFSRLGELLSKYDLMLGGMLRMTNVGFEISIVMVGRQDMI